MATQNYFNNFLHPEIDPRESLGSYWTIFDGWLLLIILDTPEERDDLIIYAVECKIYQSIPGTTPDKKFSLIPFLMSKNTYARPGALSFFKRLSFYANESIGE